MEGKMNAIERNQANVEREDMDCDRFKALIFDFDGLLVDTESCMFKAWEALMKPYGVDVSPLQVAGLVGSSAPATALYHLYRYHVAAGRTARCGSVETQSEHRRAQSYSPQKTLLPPADHPGTPGKPSGNAKARHTSDSRETTKCRQGYPIEGAIHR